MNGDGSIDRKELKSLFTTFFKVLEEKKIDILVANDTDIQA